VTKEVRPTQRDRGFSTYARYRSHYIYLVEGRLNEYIETWNVFDMPSSAGDRFHTVASGEEGLRGIALIAYEYYSRPDLWWVIAAVNGIYHPTTEMVAGLELRIPPVQDVLSKVM
jgi:hypothetical protein